MLLRILERCSQPYLPGGGQHGGGFFPSQPAHGGEAGEEQEGEDRGEQGAEREWGAPGLPRVHLNSTFAVPPLVVRFRVALPLNDQT